MTPEALMSKAVRALESARLLLGSGHIDGACMGRHPEILCRHSPDAFPVDLLLVLGGAWIAARGVVGVRGRAAVSSH